MGGLVISTHWGTYGLHWALRGVNRRLWGHVPGKPRIRPLCTSRRAWFHGMDFASQLQSFTSGFLSSQKHSLKVMVFENRNCFNDKALCARYSPEQSTLCSQIVCGVHLLSHGLFLHLSAIGALICRYPQLSASSSATGQHTKLSKPCCLSSDLHTLIFVNFKLFSITV
jgi:hypothetical protein